MMLKTPMREGALVHIIFEPVRPGVTNTGEDRANNKSIDSATGRTPEL